jgi:uncharacterized protein (TIGR02246 family)
VFPLGLALIVAACAGGEPEADATSEAEAPADPTMAAETAIDALRADWVTHYNLHHPDMVAEFYTDSAWILNADQSVDEGRDAVLASLTSAMSVSPTAAVSTDDLMVFGEHAVGRGTYQIDTAPEGAEATSWGGAWLAYFRQVDGRWLIEGMLTNYDSPRPEGWTWAETTDEAPPEETTMAEFIESFETHFNLNHPDMVADHYSEDASVAFGDGPFLEGRAAVAAELASRMEATPATLDVHGVGTLDLDESHKLDGGWFELKDPASGDVVSSGMYINLAERAADGTWTIKWAVTNSKPAAAPAA